MAKKKKKKTKQKMEFSKIAFLCIAVIFSYVIVNSFDLMRETGTTDALPHLIAATTGLMTTVSGFYFWKAKVENTIKISKENGLTVKEVNAIGKSVEENNDYNTDYNTDSMI